MDNQAHNRIKDLLSQHNQVGIVLSKNPHVDHAAAGLSLYLAVRQLGKQAVVASPTAPTVEISNLVGIDKVKNSLGTDGADLTVAFPYKEGEIEKVSYTLENGYLNIVVKAGDKGLSFQDKDIQFKRAEGKVPPLMFFVGVSRLTDLGNMFNPDAFKNTTIVNIDNRPDNQGFGDVIMVSPKFSSVSEQVAHLLTQLEMGLDVDQDIAQNLLSGISHATNDFQDPKTSYLAFEMAGVLMRKGATRQRTSQKEEKQSNASFFPYQPQRPQSGQQQQRQQFPRPQFPRPFQSQQSQQEQQAPQQNQGQQVQSNQQLRQQDNGQQKQAPSDWLTPKVYKGSTVI